MRILSAALTREKNQVESTHVMTMAFQIDIQGAPAPFRLVNYDQDLVMHGQLFTRFPVDVDSLEEATSAALVSVRMTPANVDRQIISLLENYWASVADPYWTVTIWEIDASDPDQTPFSAGQVFTVAQVSTDLMTAMFDLVAEGYSLTTIVPRRRYTSTSGYMNIPRRG